MDLQFCTLVLEFLSNKKGETMKKLLIAAAVGAFTTASWANEVPALGSVLESLSGEEMSSFEESLVGATSLNADIELAFSTETVELALEQGLITEEEAQDVAGALEILEANAEFFQFDIQDVIFQALEEGDVSLDEITLTLNAFNQLSDAGKAIVGQENFDPNDLSAADKAIYDSVTPADEQ